MALRRAATMRVDGEAELGSVPIAGAVVALNLAAARGAQPAGPGVSPTRWDVAPVGALTIDGLAVMRPTSLEGDSMTSGQICSLGLDMAIQPAVVSRGRRRSG